MKEFKTNGDLVIVSAISKKTDKPYFALCLDLGYTTKYLTFNAQDIAEICGCSVIEITKLTPGIYPVGYDN